MYAFLLVSKCTSDFQCRFKGGISVQKHLKLIVDTGNSMGNAVPPDYPLASGKTFLEVTSKIILKLFKTVSPDDLISVGSFNSSGYYQLGSQVIPQPGAEAFQKEMCCEHVYGRTIFLLYVQASKST